MDIIVMLHVKDTKLDKARMLLMNLQGLIKKPIYYNW